MSLKKNMMMTSAMMALHNMGLSNVLSPNVEENAESLLNVIYPPVEHLEGRSPNPLQGNERCFELSEKAKRRHELKKKASKKQNKHQTWK